jgi:hypothetical protein
MSAKLVSAFLLAAALPLAAAAEEFTMDTYYPSPAGVYNNVTVTSNTALASDGGTVVIGARLPDGKHQLQVEGSAGVALVEMEGFTDGNIQDAALKEGETKPAAGRILFNKDKNKFYYTSGDAIASDRTTWLKPIDGFDSEIVGDATSTADAVIAAGWTRVKPLSIAKGYAWKSPVQGLQLLGNAAKKLTKSGFYVAEVTGRYCTSDATPRIRILVTYAYGGNWYNLTTMDENVDPADLVAVGSDFCYDFSQSGMAYFRAGYVITFTVRSARSAAGDRINSGMKMTVERVMSF